MTVPFVSPQVAPATTPQGHPRGVSAGTAGLGTARASSEPRDTTGFASSGQSPGHAGAPGQTHLSASQRPTLHLLGVGKVGAEFLAQLAAMPIQLVAVSDRSGTAFARAGLDPLAIRAHKLAGSPIVAWPHAETIPTELAIGLCAADVVVDATPTDQQSTAAAIARVQAALRIGAHVALCGKNALAAQAAAWLGGATRRRLGIDAVLGGAGAQLVRELDELRAHCAGVVLAGNVTTTVVIETIERGGTFADGLAAARARGLLESDPTCDFDGSDAATKLVCVHGALFGEAFVRAVPVESVQRQDLRELDPELLRARHRAGQTTRLLARAARGGALRVGYEAVPIGSPLAAPSDRVVYAYELPAGLRVHTGTAVGADRTAAALLADVRALLAVEVRS